MRYERMYPAVFHSRPNRFVAHITAEGRDAVCHVKNTGRCRELLVPGASVWVQKADNPLRKTPYDLIAAEKGGRLINMDASAPNAVFGEWVRAGHFLPDVTQLRPEYTHEDSRFDFFMKSGGMPVFVEVKGVTLEFDGVVRFPDAPTLRGVKHLKGLTRLAQSGAQAWAVFVVQMADVTRFEPNEATHPEFAAALRQAARAGVHVLALECAVTPHSLTVTKEVPVCL